jgi:hypothetical protein
MFDRSMFLQWLWTRFVAVGQFLLVAMASAVVMGKLIGLLACTPEQRAVVKTIVDLVELVCDANDDQDTCLGKMQAHRAAARAASSAGDLASAPTAEPDAAPPP